MRRGFKGLIILIFFSIACKGSGKKKPATVASKLIGEWNNIYMKVGTYSEINPDSTVPFEVDKDQWEEKLKIKPSLTFFRADSSWNSAYYNLKDSLLSKSSGKWWINGDSLVMQQSFPSPEIVAYKLIVNADTLG